MPSNQTGGGNIIALFEDSLGRLWISGGEGLAMSTDAAAALTHRQREILQRLAEGRSAKEIGSGLEISPRTVELHTYQRMETLGIHTNAELVRFALKHGIVAL